MAAGTHDPCAVLLTKYKRWGRQWLAHAGRRDYGPTTSRQFRADPRDPALRRDDVPMLVCQATIRSVPTVHPDLPDVKLLKTGHRPNASGTILDIEIKKVPRIGAPFLYSTTEFTRSGY